MPVLTHPTSTTLAAASEHARLQQCAFELFGRDWPGAMVRTFMRTCLKALSESGFTVPRRFSDLKKLSDTACLANYVQAKVTEPLSGHVLELSVSITVSLRTSEAGKVSSWLTVRNGAVDHVDDPQTWMPSEVFPVQLEVFRSNTDRSLLMRTDCESAFVEHVKQAALAVDFVQTSRRLAEQLSQALSR